MEVFEIYTIGSGYFLERVFNAVRLIFDSGLSGALKVASICSLIILALRASVTSDFKETIKWIIGITVLTSVFLASKAKVVIHEQLPNGSGVISSPYYVDNVPWGLAMIGSVTSTLGKTLMEKFDLSFAGSMNNSVYQKYGIMFGSKIIEDANKIRISNPDLQILMVRFYRQCIVPDLKMGRTRKNGYTFLDLAQTEDIAAFLKTHSSNARTIYINSSVIKNVKKDGVLGDIFGSSKTEKTLIDGYISCNIAAHHIADMIDYEIRNKELSPNFVAQFMGNYNNSNSNNSLKNQNAFYESVLQDTYGMFLRSSRQASAILMQNVMINTIRDSAANIADNYAQVSSEELTRSSLVSISQTLQKFLPIIRSVFECLFYGVFPLVLILMVTPIGFDVLKNYAFSFLYLQMWPPMYAILFSMMNIWYRFSTGGIKHTMQYATQLESINCDISMVSGYMLALVPVLSLFITRGLLANVANLASSMLHVPQTSAVQSAEQTVKGNYAFGNTNIDTHSNDILSANKHDDNYSWTSGMKSLSLPSGSMMRISSDNRLMLDNAGSLNQTSNLARVSLDQVVGNKLDELQTDAITRTDKYSKDYAENISSSYSKMLGYDKNFTKGTAFYENWQSGLTHEQRESISEVSGITERFSKEHGISTDQSLRMFASAGMGFKVLGTGISAEVQSNHSKSETKAIRDATEMMKNKQFASNFSKVKSIAESQSFSSSNTQTQSLLESVKTDLSWAQSASYHHAQAMDELSSIQHMRGNYENNSASISQDITNLVIDHGIKKYGAHEMDRILREEPETIKSLSKDYLSDKGFYSFQKLLNTDEFKTLKGKDIRGGDIKDGLGGMDDTSISSLHNTHKKEILDTSKKEIGDVTDSNIKESYDELKAQMANEKIKVDAKIAAHKEQIEKEHNEFKKNNF